MFLHVENKEKFLDLHLTTRLHDWDMNEEVKLATTTDQSCPAITLEKNLTKWHYLRISSETSPAGEENLPLDPADREDSVEPSLWLMVNPNLACPIIHPTITEPELLKLPTDTPGPGSSSSAPVQNLHTLPQPGETSLDESLDESQNNTSLSSEDQSPDPDKYGETSLDESLDESQDDTSLSSEDQLTEVDVSVANVSRCCKRKGAQKWQRPKNPSLRKLRGAEIRRLAKAMQENCNLKVGEWPRPPVNLCILIALALSCSPSGCLSVQQIYSFIRENFPVFMKGSDGWKNSVRHNLCFSINFEKTGEQVCMLKRMSYLWRMTQAGRQRLRKEFRTLTAESLKMLKRSMRYPGILKALFKL